MAKRIKKYDETSEEGKKTRPLPPTSTPEADENQMISLAMNLARKQLMNGTASSQTINHFLMLATQKNKLEQLKLEAEIEEKHAKAAAYEAAAESEEKYAEVIEVMKKYTGYEDD